MSELDSLVTQAQSGDLQCYGELVRRFQDMAVGYAFSRLGDFHLAEDAAQEAFLEAHACLPRVRAPGAFPGWLRRIVFKHCDRFTRRRRAPTIPFDDTRHADAHGPESLLEAHETSAAVWAGIDRLPEHERTVIALHYLGELAHAAIAAFLGVPRTAVSNRLHAEHPALIAERLTTLYGPLATEDGSAQPSTRAMAPRDKD